MIDSTVTPAEAAKLCHVTRTTIYTWLKDGRLHATRVGPRKLLIRRADLPIYSTPPAPPELLDLADVATRTALQADDVELAFDLFAAGTALRQTPPDYALAQHHAAMATVSCPGTALPFLTALSDTLA